MKKLETKKELIKYCNDNGILIEAYSPKEKHVGNNVLMENSIVFDGAYPNAIIQSATGEGIETPNGKLKRLEGKENLSEKENTFHTMKKNGATTLWENWDGAHSHSHPMFGAVVEYIVKYFNEA